MRRFICTVLIVALVSPLLAQQPMPNRKEDIEKLPNIGRYVSLLNGDDVRRREVLGFICADLNANVPADGNNWGLLFKPNRSRQPADALVWKPTDQHADVLTDTGLMWKAHANTIKQENEDWLWVPCSGDGPTTPEPPPPTGSGGEVPLPPGTGAAMDAIFDEVIRRLMTVENEILIDKAEGRITQGISQQAAELARQAVEEIKAHRAGVQAVWLKVSAIAGPIIGALLTFLNMRKDGAE